MTNPPKIEGEEGRAVNFPGETISIRDGRLRRALCRKTGPPGAGTNCERKKYITKYRKYHIKPHEKLLRFGPALQKGVQVILSLSKRTRAVKTWWEGGPHSLPQKDYATRPREFQNLKPSAARLYFIFLSHCLMPLIQCHFVHLGLYSSSL